MTTKVPRNYVAFQCVEFYWMRIKTSFYIL